MKLQPGFKLLVCTVLFSAGLWAGSSEAASITFDKFVLMHGSAISTSFNAAYLTDFGLTIIAGKLNIPGWPGSGVKSLKSLEAIKLESCNSS